MSDRTRLFLLNLQNPVKKYLAVGYDSTYTIEFSDKINTRLPDQSSFRLLYTCFFFFYLYIAIALIKSIFYYTFYIYIFVAIFLFSINQ